MSPMVTRLLVAAAATVAVTHGIIPDAVGKFQCPTNSVLAVIDVTHNAIYMSCVLTAVCRQPVTCTYREGGCEPAHPTTLSFLSGIKEDHKRKEYATENCCTWGPAPDEHASTTCYNLAIRDVTPWVEGWKPYGSPDDAVSGADSPQANRAKRAVFVEPQDAGHAMTFLHNRPHHNKFLLINDILRTPEDDGYIVVACALQCEDSTTTTTTSSTTPSTTQPRTNGPTQEPRAPLPDVQLPTGGEVISPNHPSGWIPQPHLNLGQHGVGAGAGAGLCFSGDMSVQTERHGTVQLRHLGAQHKILVAPGVYEPVLMWYHRLEDETAGYSTITYMLDGRATQLVISANHLLPLMDCQRMHQVDDPLKHSVFASRAQPGACVSVWSERLRRLQPAAVLNVTQTTARGVYSPVTPSGQLFVNGAQASCYTTFENHPLQQALHEKVIFPLYRAYWAVVHAFEHFHFYSQPDDAGIDSPAYLGYLAYLSNCLLPEKMF